MLYFHPVVSSFFFFLLLFSSPILSRRRLDVYHTCTHDVALVRIRNVLHAAYWKYMTQKIATNSLSAHHRTTLWAISSQLGHVSTIGKKPTAAICPPHVLAISWTSAH